MNARGVRETDRQNWRPSTSEQRALKVQWEAFDASCDNVYQLLVCVAWWCRVCFRCIQGERWLARCLRRKNSIAQDSNHSNMIPSKKKFFLPCEPWCVFVPTFRDIRNQQCRIAHIRLLIPLLLQPRRLRHRISHNHTVLMCFNAHTANASLLILHVSSPSILCWLLQPFQVLHDAELFFKTFIFSAQ